MVSHLVKVTDLIRFLLKGKRAQIVTVIWSTHSRTHALNAWQSFPKTTACYYTQSTVLFERNYCYYMETEKK